MLNSKIFTLCLHQTEKSLLRLLNSSSCFALHHSISSPSSNLFSWDRLRLLFSKLQGRRGKKLTCDDPTKDSAVAQQQHRSCVCKVAINHLSMILWFALFFELLHIYIYPCLELINYHKICTMRTNLALGGFCACDVKINRRTKRKMFSVAKCHVSSHPTSHLIPPQHHVLSLFICRDIHV